VALPEEEVAGTMDLGELEEVFSGILSPMGPSEEGGERGESAEPAGAAWLGSDELALFTEEVARTGPLGGLRGLFSGALSPMGSSEEEEAREETVE